VAIPSTLETGETRSLIASDKVEGTAVYRPNGDKLGRIERVVIDKETGKVAYALMSFGGFMGIGRDYYPLPWSLLKFNPRLDGYEINISEQQLTGMLQPEPPEEQGLGAPKLGLPLSEAARSLTHPP